MDSHLILPATLHDPTLPTAFLPALNRLASYSEQDIRNALDNLRQFYWPTNHSLQPKQFIPRRPDKKRAVHDSLPDSGYASAEDDNDDDDREEPDCPDVEATTVDISSTLDLNGPELLRSDPLERAFTIKWLTGFIVRSSIWIGSSSSDTETEGRNALFEEATVLLSRFSSVEEGETAVTRLFSFPTNRMGLVQVELNDAPLPSDDHTSVGLQSWGSAILFAERICNFPDSILCTETNCSEPPRILELGAGTGLLSIVVAKLLKKSAGDIIATDFHPDVLANLSQNVSTNFPGSLAWSHINVLPLDWQFPRYSPPFDKPFQVILAADVIYHPQHATWIKSCLENLLLRPTHENRRGGVFWLIIPIRTTGRHEGMDITVEALFPEVTSSSLGDEPMLAILNKECIHRKDIGRADEGAYKLFEIGWV